MPHRRDDGTTLTPWSRDLLPMERDVPVSLISTDVNRPPRDTAAAAASGPPSSTHLGFARLTQLTDHWGVLERLEVGGSAAPGYRTSDAARALILVLREYLDSRATAMTAVTYLTFLEGAVRQDGVVHERLSSSRHWADNPDRSDAWGWSVAALGTAARLGPSRATRARAVKAFLRAARGRSPDARASALAVLGAVALVRARSDASGAARSLLADCLETIPRQATSGWAWPEARLGHNNAVLCDALIVGGAALGRSVPVHQGLSMLSMLLDTETSPDGHLSPTGDLGRAAHETGSCGSQRPADVAAIAEACAHAFAVTGDRHWRHGVRLAWNWFLGLNDLGVRVYDPGTGIANETLAVEQAENAGTEATLAALSTQQRARDVGAWEQE